MWNNGRGPKNHWCQSTIWLFLLRVLSLKKNAYQHCFVTYLILWLSLTQTLLEMNRKKYHDCLKLAKTWVETICLIPLFYKLEPFCGQKMNKNVLNRQFWNGQYSQFSWQIIQLILWNEVLNNHPIKKISPESPQTLFWFKIFWALTAFFCNFASANPKKFQRKTRNPCGIMFSCFHDCLCLIKIYMCILKRGSPTIHKNFLFLTYVCLSYFKSFSHFQIIECTRTFTKNSHIIC